MKNIKKLADFCQIYNGFQMNFNNRATFCTTILSFSLFGYLPSRKEMKRKKEKDCSCYVFLFTLFGRYLSKWNIDFKFVIPGTSFSKLRQVHIRQMAHIRLIHIRVILVKLKHYFISKNHIIKLRTFLVCQFIWNDPILRN